MEKGKKGGKMQRLLLLVLLGLLLLVTIGETSFLIKRENGLERLVVAIDERLELSKDVVTFPNLTNGTATYHCHTLLENLKKLLQRTSEYLFKSTHGQTHFRQISILLPSNWATPNCTGTGHGDQEIAAATYETPNSADIQLTPDHPVYNDKPWTLQYGPCGVPGKRISVPLSFVGESTEDPGLRARLLLREWLKSRYGVFEESGFAHDEKYPAEYTQSEGGESMKVVSTACHLNRSCTNSSGCEAENHTQKLSLMSLPLDGEGVELCTEKTHIRTTPTKHNFLCDGQSISEVMQKHADFTNLEPTHHGGSRSARKLEITHPPAIQFSYTTLKSHRIIFLLDRSRTMNQNNRWVNLRQTIYRLFHYLPSGVELGVISYTNSTTTSLPLSITSTHNRDHLHGRIPLKPIKEPTTSCISCAVRDALKLIKFEGDTGPTTLVLLNSSPANELMEELVKVNELLELKPLKLVVITYAEDFHNFTQLPPYTQLYRIPETQFSSNLEQNDNLNGVFLQTVTDAIGTPLIKVHQTLKWPNNEWQSQGQFMMEENLGRNTWVTISTEEIGDVDGLQLISPSGKEFDLPLHAEGLVFIRIPGIAEGGIWNYIINFYKNQAPRPISIDVITESRKAETVAVRFWAHVTRSSVGFNSSEIVRLYAEVLQGDLPVLNANVTASITIPGKLHDPKPITVRLLDTGSGDPDITWGDGIYSTYFTQLGSSPGFFTLSGYVDDNRGQAVVPIHTNITRGHLGEFICCGSSVPHISTTPTGAFIRKVVSPSFQTISGIGFGEDPYPPSRITDLRVERTLESTSELKLSWTSPGGDFDKGKASRYEIRCYTSREALTNDNFATQGILVHNSLTPAPEEYGIRQSCTVGIPWANEIFYYGIVSIDNALNRGKVSNLVSVLIKELPTSTVNVIDAWEDDALVYNLTSYRSLSHQNEHTMFHAGATWFRGLSEIELYIIIGGTGTFLILVSTCVLILVCVKKSKNKGTESGPPAYQNIYLENGKSEHGSKLNEGIKCCWENEVDSPAPCHQQKQNELQSSYFRDNSSYIPASVLCSPSIDDEGNQIYRDLYVSTNTHLPRLSLPDSSSVTSNHSKPSDSGSIIPCNPIHGFNNLHNPEGKPANHPRTPPSDDEDGGFRSHLNCTPDSKGGYYEYDYDSPSIENGSNYSGCPSSANHSNYNKRKTRHISFV